MPALDAKSAREQTSATFNVLREKVTICPPDHPYFKHHAISTAVGGMVQQAAVADIDCSGFYTKALRDANGSSENAVIFRPTESGDFEQIYVPGGRSSGLFALFGKLDSRVVLTVDVHTAALIHDSTDENTIAVLSIENLPVVCDQIAILRPDIEQIVAIDGKDGDVKQNPHLFKTAAEIAHTRSIKVAVSGASHSFVELQATSGAQAIREQLEIAALPTHALAFDDVISVSHVHMPTSPLQATCPQNGSSLMHDLVAAVRRSVITSHESSLAIALWIIFTHVFKLFSSAPLLVATSPEPRCGKTSLLTLLARLCRASFAASNMTEAGIYRSIHQWSPTLIIDEADTFMLNNKAMTGIINSGYKKTTGYVVRTNKDGVIKLPTFCPKAIALIGALPEAMMDRAIAVELERKLSTEEVEPVSGEGPDDLTFLHSRIRRWVADNANSLSLIKPEKIGVLNDRAEDNYRPLLAIATQLGGLWLDKATASFVKISTTHERAPSHGEWLLADTARAFAKHGDDRIMTTELLDYLNSQEEAPWSTFSHGREMTPRILAQMFKRYGISSMLMRKGDAVVRGYQLQKFTQVFKRYGSGENKP
jgi:hypothetical protein